MDNCRNKARLDRSRPFGDAILTVLGQIISFVAIRPGKTASCCPIWATGSALRLDARCQSKVGCDQAANPAEVASNRKEREMIEENAR
jgi:hypothetical protein